MNQLNIELMFQIQAANDFNILAQDVDSKWGYVKSVFIAVGKGS